MRGIRPTVISFVGTLLWPGICGLIGGAMRRDEFVSAAAAPAITFDTTGVILLVAIPQGAQAGAEALQRWGNYTDVFAEDLPPVWVLCPTPAEAETVRRASPRLSPLVLSPSSSWATVLDDFMAEQEASLLGLFGEGSYPSPGLAGAIRATGTALAYTQTPAAVIPRSRSLGKGEWLPDSFVAQVWMNRAMLPRRGTFNTSALDHHAARDLPLLIALPLILGHQEVEAEEVLVDGTNVLRSSFAVGSYVDPSGGNVLPVATDSGGAKVYIGTLHLALAWQGDGSETVEIVRAAWPPRYVLEHTATDEGVVIVSNVNCGYLDMSVNFMMSVQRTSGAKVFFVTMDEVSFDFLDALAPGTAAMFPTKAGSVRQHASKAGEFGDPAFAAEVLVRPTILYRILAQRFAVLWSDSDVVWLDNPLPLLPDTRDPEDSEVMLQHDGRDDMTCTCFMFLKPTERAHKLLVLWKQNMITHQSDKNQVPFQVPLRTMVDAGLRLEYIPDEVMPHGRKFFDAPFVQDYAKTVHPEARIAHNNFIKGHEKKRARFQRYDLWWVDGMHFPDCEA